GTRLRGWKVEADRWRVELPKTWRFSQLWADGVRRFRPRANAGNYLHIADAAPPDEIYPGEGDNRFHFSPGDIRSDWHNLGDVDVLTFHHWTMSRLPIDSIDDA